MKPDKSAKRWQKNEARAELEAKNFARQAVRGMELDARVIEAVAAHVDLEDLGEWDGRPLVCSNRLVLASRDLRSGRRC